MTPFHQDAWLTQYVGDCRTVLAELPAESVHCIVTSPPYWALRDYGTASWSGGQDGHEHVGKVPRTPPPGTPKRASKRGSTNVRSGDCACGALRIDGQLGLEASPAEFIATMVDVFREVRRVLRRDGTLWLNIGDTYASTAIGDLGVKPKDLVGVPWRLALAMQADGWYLRRDIVWSKPNPMPESVTDRPTSSHEYLFLLARSERYFYDADAVREPAISAAELRYMPADAASIDGTSRRTGATTRRFGAKAAAMVDLDNRRRGLHASADASEAGTVVGRNLRSVWPIATEPYPGAHFATFPQRLVEPCIRAGTSERGVCPSCGAPWVRQIDVEYSANGRSTNGPRSTDRRSETAGFAVRLERVSTTTGWRPSCRHSGQPDDYEIIATPVGDGRGGEYHRARLTTARRGLDRGRLPDEGVRAMFRWEQRAFAGQLHSSEHRADMEAEAGAGAFAHYARTDRSGARAIPPQLLAAWLERGWLAWPVEALLAEEPIPATVLDPFGGSGTTALVAERLGRRSILIDLSPEYAAQALERIAGGRRNGTGAAIDLELPAPSGSLWALEAEAAS